MDEQRRRELLSFTHVGMNTLTATGVNRFANFSHEPVVSADEQKAKCLATLRAVAESPEEDENVAIIEAVLNKDVPAMQAIVKKVRAKSADGKNSWARAMPDRVQDAAVLDRLSRVAVWAAFALRDQPAEFFDESKIKRAANGKFASKGGTKSADAAESDRMDGPPPLPIMDALPVRDRGMSPDASRKATRELVAHLRGKAKTKEEREMADLVEAVAYQDTDAIKEFVEKSKKAKPKESRISRMFFPESDGFFTTMADRLMSHLVFVAGARAVLSSWGANYGSVFDDK